MAETFGTFTKNHPATGERMERVAYTPADAVQYRFDGWAQKPKPAVEPARGDATAEKPAEKPDADTKPTEARTRRGGAGS